MKRTAKQWATMLFAVLAMLVPSLYADDASMEQEAEQTMLGAGTGNAAEKIEAKFAGFAGDKTQTLVEALRAGDPLSYVIQVEQPVFDEEGNPVMIDVVNEDGTVTQVQKTEFVDQTITVGNTAGPLGYGGVVLALGLAQATLPEGSEYKDIVAALFNTDTGAGILDMRANKMGWGQIYAAFDLKVGDVMSAIHSARPEKASKPEKPAKPDKPAKPEKPVKPEKPTKPEKPAKPEKVSK